MMPKARPRIVVGILTHDRAPLLARTLFTFREHFQDSWSALKILLHDDGSPQQAERANRALASDFGATYRGRPFSGPPPGDNAGRDRRIAAGHQALAIRMLKEPAAGYLLLEDDWACLESLNLWQALERMEEDGGIGQIRLRRVEYDNSPTGCSSRNFVTREPIRWCRTAPLGGKELRYGNLHWVNNPSLLSREALEVAGAGFQDELARMEAFHRAFPRNAQVVPGIFTHIGPWRRRPDLVRQGLFGEQAP